MWNSSVAVVIVPSNKPSFVIIPWTVAVSSSVNYYEIKKIFNKILRVFYLLMYRCMLFRG